MKSREQIHRERNFPRLFSTREVIAALTGLATKEEDSALATGGVDVMHFMFGREPGSLQDSSELRDFLNIALRNTHPKLIEMLEQGIPKGTKYEEWVRHVVNEIGKQVELRSIHMQDSQ